MSDVRGPELDPATLEPLLGWLLDRGDEASQNGGVPTPVCLWGLHGVGKTTLVGDVVRERGWAFATCSPGQLEEMGDLHGLPVLRGDRTEYAPPSWVPREPGPGVLLLDDLNRADDRILRGLMALMQTGAMLSWRLPPRWQIVATANPEGGDYSVTPMDPAMVDRMLHLTVAFDAKAWATWATRAGVDPRGVSFVLMYPEIVAGERTTPRSLVRFFELLRGLPDLRAQRERVWHLGRAVLEEAAVAAFLSFVDDNLSCLLEPWEVLDSTDAAELSRRLVVLGRDGEVHRVDRVATVGTRLYLHLTAAGYAPRPEHGPNLVRFLMHEVVPADLRLSLHRDLLAKGGAAVAGLLRDAALAAAVLKAM